MAETKGFDLAALLQGVSDLDTEEQITRIPLDLIDPDPDNFYSLDGLDELAGNIELVGLLDPIRVRPSGERYTVVSGHRRRAACLLIRDGGSTMFQSGVPCIVEYGQVSDAMRKLRLIYANSATRQLTAAEQSRQAEEVTQLLCELKAQGVEFPGRMRDHVAAACNLTKTKIGRLHAIRSRAHEYILDAFDQGKINESVAYEFSKLDRALQHRIWLNYIRLMYRPEALTAEYVVKLGALYDKLKKTTCKKMNPKCWCISAESRFDYAQKQIDCEGVHTNCSKGRCCIGCPDIAECEYACLKCSEERSQAINDREKRKQAAEYERALTQLANDRARSQQDEENAAVWARIRKAAETSGAGLGNVFAEFCETRSDVDEALRFANGTQMDTNHFGLQLLDDCLIDLADLLGCSTDYLLWRTEAVRPAGIDGQPPVGKPLDWLMGTPCAVGWYAAKVRMFNNTLPAPRVFWWDGETWIRDREKNLPIDRAYTVTGWLPLPEV